MKMFAVIQTGGKQYRVQENDIIYVEKLDVEDGAQVTFEEVVAIANDGDITVGAPFVAGATVTGTVVKSGKGKKITVFTYKSKKDSKRKTTLQKCKITLHSPTTPISHKPLTICMLQHLAHLMLTRMAKPMKNAFIIT